jgi:hypothetical protein
MASLVGAFAASHGPLIVREWESVPPEQKQRMSEGFRELGRGDAAAVPANVPLELLLTRLRRGVRPPVGDHALDERANAGECRVRLLGGEVAHDCNPMRRWNPA